MSLSTHAVHVLDLRASSCFTVSLDRSPSFHRGAWACGRAATKTSEHTNEQANEHARTAHSTARACAHTGVLRGVLVGLCRDRWEGKPARTRHAGSCRRRRRRGRCRRWRRRWSRRRCTSKCRRRATRRTHGCTRVSARRCDIAITRLHARTNARGRAWTVPHTRAHTRVHARACTVYIGSGVHAAARWCRVVRARACVCVCARVCIYIYYTQIYKRERAGCSERGPGPSHSSRANGVAAPSGWRFSST